jgi:hypothetical protein
MRRAALCLAGALLAAGLLAGCGPAAVSYNDGFAVGETLAEAAGPGALEGNALIRAACEQQWHVSGPATDDRAVWVQGCVAGIHKLQSSVGLPAVPPAGPLALGPTTR